MCHVHCCHCHTSGFYGSPHGSFVSGIFFYWLIRLPNTMSLLIPRGKWRPKFCTLSHFHGWSFTRIISIYFNTVNNAQIGTQHLKWYILSLLESAFCSRSYQSLKRKTLVRRSYLKRKRTDLPPPAPTPAPKSATIPDTFLHSFRGSRLNTTALSDTSEPPLSRKVYPQSVVNRTEYHSTSLYARRTCFTFKVL